jgi:hypothetical protein
VTGNVSMICRYYGISKGAEASSLDRWIAGCRRAKLNACDE